MIKRCSLSFFIIFILYSLFLYSCLNRRTPGFKADHIVKPNTKINLKVAVLLNNSFESYEVEHVDYNLFTRYGENTSGYGDELSLNVGKSLANIFKKTLPMYFEDVTFLNNLSDNSPYDLIIIPKILSVDLYSDEYTDRQIWPDPYRYGASLDLEMKLKDPEGSVIFNKAKLNNIEGFSTALIGEYEKVMSEAEITCFNQLMNSILNDTVFKGYVRQSQIKQKSPANLLLAIQYSDKASILPNNSIDATEKPFIIAKVQNKGKGTAFDVKLYVKNNEKEIRVPKEFVVGNIGPGSSKEIKIPITAGFNMGTGKTSFSIIAKEERGFDSKSYKLIVPTFSLSLPQINISDYKLNDSNVGLGSGNGNGIPENGETIELTSLVKNSGKGKAIKVKLAIEGINPDIEIVREKAVISEILPGLTATGKLAFTIPRTYSGGEINIDLSASDVREGASYTSKTLALKMISNRPNLAYDYRVIDDNGILENGEDGEIEVTVANNGLIAARNVIVSLESSELFFVKTKDSISNIPANSKYSPIRFAFKVPRTLEKNFVDIPVQMKQQDFQGLNSNIHLPVHLVVPEFQISHHLLDPNNNGIIEQGEVIDLVVRVRNTGGLEADDVQLKMDIDKEGVIAQGSHTVSIGRIAAGKDSGPVKFQLLIKRSTQAGALPISFAITQKDFSRKILPMSLNISEEQVEVITVAGEKQEATAISPIAATRRVGIPPLVYVATPQNGKRVAANYEILSGIIGDDKGVASYLVTLNGRRLDTGRDIVVKPRTGNSQTEEQFRIKIPLQIGKNEIVVTAFDVENLSGSKRLTIYREAEKGEIYAAVIGINQYKSPDVPPLRYARNDAQAFAGYLREHMGLDSSHLFELYDSQATKLRIETLLGADLSLKARRPEDTVIIYFAGHGAPEPNPSSSDPDNLSKYILAHDSVTDPGYMFSTAIDMDRIAEIFTRIRAERVIFIADSCYSGGSGGRTWSSNSRRANISDAFLERIARAGKGRIILTSSNAQEVSQESDELRHGYFTYYLLEGLKGKADISKDGEIDVDEIYNYLNKWVPKATGNTQHPTKKGEAQGRVILGKVR